MTPVERALAVVAGLVLFAVSSYATAWDDHRIYRRPRLATLANVAATAACVYGAHEKGAGSWLGLACAAGALFGAWLTMRAIGDWLAARSVAKDATEWAAKRAASRKAGDR